MKNRWMLVVAICFALLGSACGEVPAKRADKGLTIQIYFDGGYLYDLSGSDAVDVYSLGYSKYPMLMQVGSAVGTPLKLGGTTVTLRLDKAAPTPLKPAIPPLASNQTGCKDADMLARNNRLFIPDLGEVAALMGTKLKSVASLNKQAGIHLTGGGELSVIQLGGCVQYQDSTGKPVSAERSMASGIAGIMYEWRDTGASSLTVVQTDAGGKETLTEATPNASGIFVLYVSSFLKSSTTDAPHRIDHFKDHFDEVFEKIDETKRVSLWWLNKYLVSPGIDCPPGSIP